MQNDVVCFVVIYFIGYIGTWKIHIRMNPCEFNQNKYIFLACKLVYMKNETVV